MKIYFAGSFNLNKEQLNKIGVQNKLYSFTNERDQAQEWGSKGLMLDSGAFTVLTKNIAVNIDELIAFIKKYKPEVSVQLDVIGDDAATWANYIYMKKEVDVIPVIHYRASEEHIKRVLAVSDYILLGGLVPLTRQKKELFRWLDHLYSRYSLQKKKIHLLGVTTKSVLERYPVYSSDSSAALSIVRYPSSDHVTKFYQKTKHYKDTYTYGVTPILTLQNYITQLWAKRGIVWDK